MKLDYPLAGLISGCETVCTSTCCGVSAYSFSPIQIAAYLTRDPYADNCSEIRRIYDQINSLRANYGTRGKIGQGATIEEMNAMFTAEQIEDFAIMLLTNLDIGLKLNTESEKLRFRKAKSDTSANN